MAEVSDGGLQFKIDAPGPSVVFSGINSGELSGYQTYMQNSYTRAGNNFRAITESLKNALKGQKRFFLPASGIYFKNPIYNNEGSLLCEVEYNGDAEIEPNDGADARADVKDSQIRQMLPGISQPVTTIDENKNKGATK